MWCNVLREIPLSHRELKEHKLIPVMGVPIYGTPIRESVDGVRK